MTSTFLPLPRMILYFFRV